MGGGSSVRTPERWVTPSSAPFNCRRWYPAEIGILWILQLQRAFYTQRFKGDVQSHAGVSPLGLEKMPVPYLLPTIFLALCLEASGGSLASSAMANFKSHCHSLMWDWPSSMMAQSVLLLVSEGHETLQPRHGSMDSPQPIPRAIKDTASGPDKSS